MPKTTDSGKYTGNIDELRKKYCEPEQTATDSSIGSVSYDDDHETKSTTFQPHRKKRENQEFAVKY